MSGNSFQSAGAHLLSGLSAHLRNPTNNNNKTIAIDEKLSAELSFNSRAAAATDLVQSSSISMKPILAMQNLQQQQQLQTDSTQTRYSYHQVTNSNSLLEDCTNTFHIKDKQQQQQQRGAPNLIPRNLIFNKSEKQQPESNTTSKPVNKQSQRNSIHQNSIVSIENTPQPTTSNPIAKRHSSYGPVKFVSSPGTNTNTNQRDDSRNGGLSAGAQSIPLRNNTHQYHHQHNHAAATNNFVSPQVNSNNNNNNNNNQQQQQLRTPYVPNESPAMNSSNQYGHRAKTVISQNKENLERNLVKLNSIQQAERKKADVVIRAIDSKQSYWKNKMHSSNLTAKGQSTNSHNIFYSHSNQIGSQTHMHTAGRILPSSFQESNPNSNNTNSNVLLFGDSIENISQQMSQQQQQQHAPLIASEKKFQNYLDASIRVQQTSQRGKSTKRVIIQSNEDNILFSLGSLNRNNAEKIGDSQNTCGDNSTFGLTEITSTADAQSSSQPTSENPNGQTASTNTEWMKLQVNGNKITNVPSNIEDEVNRIQVLAEKNEVAMQEYISIRKQAIQIQTRLVINIQIYQHIL